MNIMDWIKYKHSCASVQRAKEPAVQNKESIKIHCRTTADAAAAAAAVASGQKVFSIGGSHGPRQLQTLAPVGARRHQTDGGGAEGKERSEAAALMYCIASTGLF